MAPQDLEEIFEELKEYIGPVLQCARMARVTGSSEFSKKSLIALHNHIDRYYFSLIEKGIVVISFEEFKIICQILGYNVATVLKQAKFLESQEFVSEKETAEELIKEIDFWIWKTKRGEA